MYLAWEVDLGGSVGIFRLCAHTCVAAFHAIAIRLRHPWHMTPFLRSNLDEMSLISYFV